MTTKESFEAWYDDEEITPLPDDYTILGKRYLYMGWCAATTEANKRIAELESEVEKLNNNLYHAIEHYAKDAETIARLKAIASTENKEQWEADLAAEYSDPN